MANTELNDLIEEGAKYLAQGNLKDALKCFEKAKIINPEDPRAWNGIGLVYVRSQKYKEAINFFTRASELEKDDERRIGILCNLGGAYLYLHDFNNVLKNYEEALRNIVISKQKGEVVLEVLKEIARFFIRAGEELKKKEMFERAIECCDRVLQIDKKDTDSLSNKAAALSELGRNEEALEILNIALQIEENSAELWYNKGMVLKELKKGFSALGCFKKAKELFEKKQNKVMVKECENQIEKLGRRYIY